MTLHFLVVHPKAMPIQKDTGRHWNVPSTTYVTC